MACPDSFKNRVLLHSEKDPIEPLFGPSLKKSFDSSSNTQKTSMQLTIHPEAMLPLSLPSYNCPTISQPLIVNPFPELSSICHSDFNKNSDYHSVPNTFSDDYLSPKSPSECYTEFKSLSSNLLAFSSSTVDTNIKSLIQNIPEGELPPFALDYNAKLEIVDNTSSSSLSMISTLVKFTFI